ncbi:arylsulfotransferase family protein [uncultured Roseobacter sp.]|uniref:arylsulfotransferase family protein n=1 Tax=uncultured Roseobacter sp. TaxID=114847 RepID=UPI00261B1183|nr:arylsulfotransferase family protein [uncultured Roseobacter sp.]
MERWLAKKVELRILLGAVLLMLLLTWVFGWLVYNRLSGGERFGSASSAAVLIVSAPKTAQKILSGDLKLDDHEVRANFDEAGGFTFFREPEAPQYVLVSRYDGNIRWSVVELYREGESDPIHVWKFDRPEEFAFASENRFAVSPKPRKSHLLRTVHPQLMPDGSLVVHSHYSGLYRVDACSKPIWTNAEFGFHHSVEISPEGDIWTPGTVSPEIEGYGWNEKTYDDHIVKVSPEGEVLYAKSVLQMLIDADLINLIYDYDVAVQDPIHLNDIEPVRTDGEIAKRGDVFLSLGHLNMVLLFRPATDEIIWYSQDLMMHQHDVDPLGPDSISVYDNRRKTDADGKPFVLGLNELLRFDLPGKKAEQFFLDEMSSMDIRTFNQGLSDAIAGSGRMVEETSRGRLIKFGEDGAPDWVFLNRSENDRLWVMNWSRYLPKAVGDVAVEALAATKC